MNSEDSTHGLLGFEVESLRFPTDGLTLEQLRRTFPKDFGFNWQYKSNNQFRFLDTLVPVLHHEREFAARTYASAAGVAAPKDKYLDDGNRIAELIGMIAQDYEKLGISRGPIHTRELLRDLETQVIEQAGKQHRSGR